MATTKAYVTNDGEVLSQKYMDQYATKAGTSQQIPSDTFNGEYEINGVVAPLYNLEALSEILEINTYHYRSVKTKARDAAGLGWFLEPKEDVENPSDEQKDIAKEFLEQPSPDMTLTEINDQVMVDYEAIGNAAFEVIRNKEEEIIGIEHVPAHTVRVHDSMDKFLHYRGFKRVWFKRFGLEKDIDKDTGKEYTKGSLTFEQRANEMIHMKNYTSRSDFYGVPDIMPALGAVLGDRERQEYNIAFFDNHAVPAYAVTVSGAELDEETENKIQRFFQKDVKESNHSTLVLTAQKEDGDYSEEPIKFNFQALSTDTKEASFGMFRQANRDEILSAHGVPPYRAGITIEGQMGGSSASETTEIYKQSVIKPKQEKLENIINRYILEEGLGITDWIFRFNELDTRDYDSQIKRLKSIFDMGAYSPNMILEKLGEDPIDDPNMDLHFVNGKPLSMSQEGQQATNKALKDFHEKLMGIVEKEYDNETTDES